MEAVVPAALVAIASPVNASPAASANRVKSPLRRSKQRHFNHTFQPRAGEASLPLVVFWADLEPPAHRRAVSAKGGGARPHDIKAAGPFEPGGATLWTPPGASRSGIGRHSGLRCVFGSKPGTRSFRAGAAPGAIPGRTP